MFNLLKMGKKKIVIVGGGISGLTAGIYALKSGFDAEIYEKNAVVGGECTGWDRSGYHIDNCIHWMMGTTEGSALNKIWKDTGALCDEVEVLRFDKMYTSEINGDQITLWKDKERTRKELLALSPEDAVEINKLMDYVGICGRISIPANKPAELMNLFDAIKMGISMKDALKVFKAFKGMDTLDLMNRFKNPLIRCMISDFCTKESLGYSFPMAYGNFTSGDGGIPRGGSRSMALRMQKRFEELGGRVFAGVSVDKIEVSGNKASAIILADGQIIRADYLICACDPDYTFSHLLNPSRMDKVFKDVYANRKAYPVYGMFQVAFGIDFDIDVIGGEVILDCRDIKASDWMADRMTVKTYAYEPAFAPAGKQILQVLWGLSEEAYDYWANLNKDKDAYRSKKEEIACLVQQKLEQRFTEYRGKMKILDIWTPVTYRRYCNAFKGYNQAFTITKQSMKNPYPSAYVQGIENIILAGQWLSSPGGLPGAAIQGKYAVQRILKKEKRNTKL